MSSVPHGIIKIDIPKFQGQFFQRILQVPDNVGCALIVAPDIGSYFPQF